jgi:hypothetical protein
MGKSGLFAGLGTWHSRACWNSARPVRQNFSATSASGKSGTARGLRPKILTISAPVIGCLASSVKSPSSTAERSVFDAKNPHTDLHDVRRV